MKRKRIKRTRWRPSIQVLLMKRAKKQKQAGRKIAHPKALLLLAVLVFLAGFVLFSWMLRMRDVTPNDRDALIPVMDTATFKMGYMDMSGKMAVDVVYAYAGEFQNGIAVVRQEVNTQESEGIIDRKGKIVFPFTSGSLFVSSDGTVIAAKDIAPEGALVPVVRYGWFDINGKALLPFDYEFLSPFDKGRAFVQKDGAWCIIDATGGVLKQLSGIRHILSEFSGDGLVPFTTKGSNLQESLESDQWGYLNADGSVAINERYLFATKFENGVALAVIPSADGQRQTVLIDKAGREVKNLGTFAFEAGFLNGIAIGYGDHGFGALDCTGEWVVKPEYTHVSCRDGVISAEVSPAHFVFFNKRGGKLLEWKYPCTAFVGGHIFYTKSGKTYMMDIYGKTICEVPKGVAPQE